MRKIEGLFSTYSTQITTDGGGGLYADKTRHYEYMKIYKKESREFLKAKGICANCGKEPAFEGRTMCPECLDKIKESSERTRSEQSKQQRREYLKAKRERCIAVGICRDCLKRKATQGKYCIECYVKMRKRNGTHKRTLWQSLGLCYYCGDEVVKGYKTCQKHYVIMSNNLKKWNRDNSTHYWRKIQSSEVRRVRNYTRKLKSKELNKHKAAEEFRKITGVR